MNLFTILLHIIFAEVLGCEAVCPSGTHCKLINKTTESLRCVCDSGYNFLGVLSQLGGQVQVELCEGQIIIVYSFDNGQRLGYRSLLIKCGLNPLN